MPQQTILCIGLAIVLLLIFLLSLFVYLKKQFTIRFVPVLVGAVIFILFALILEPMLHAIVLRPQADGTISLKTTKPLLYILYGAFSAGVFEEVGRVVGLTFLKKKYFVKDTGIAYGLGHGGIEAILLGLLPLISNLVLGLSIRSGNQAILKTLPNKTLETVIHTPSWQYFLPFIERVPALAIQLCLSIIIWYGITQAQTAKILPLAILIHAGIDSLSACAQVGFLKNVFVLYLLLYLAAGFLIYITYHYFWSAKWPFYSTN